MPKKNWKVELSHESLRYIKKLNKKTSQGLLTAFDKFESSENPLSHKYVRPLVGKLRGFYRLRVEDKRLIFELDRENKRIGVLVIIPKR